MNDFAKSLIEMDIGERILAPDKISLFQRVPGGWVCRMLLSHANPCCFIPLPSSPDPAMRVSE